MTIDSQESKAFLYELYTMTDGDTDTQVSMYDIGERLGLEKGEASTTAENLFIQGLAELKTLSGGIGITVEGMRALDITPPNPGGPDAPSLGNAPVLGKENIEAVDQIMAEIKSALPGLGLAYEETEEVVIDIKTIGIQILSPKPKTALVREALRSIHANITSKSQAALADRLEGMIAS